MGHVVNPHLFRLNYTVFWNISVLSKKKFSAFIDLKSLLIYEFFNDYLNRYKNIQKIKLRILKIKISFYCNTVKIFFFFIKHKNINKNFKKMLCNTVDINKHYIKKLPNLNNFFLLNGQYLHNKKNSNINILYLNSNLSTKNNFFLKKKKNFKSSINYINKKFFFYNKKNNNVLFAKNYKSSILSYNFDAIKFNSFYNSKLEHKFNIESLISSINPAKNLIYKNFANLLKYIYDHDYKKLKKKKYFDFYNYNLYQNLFKKYAVNKRNFRKERYSIFREKKRIFRRLSKNRNIYNKKPKKLKFEKFVEYTDVEKEKYFKYFNKFKKKSFLKFYKKDFFFLNIKKKFVKNKKFFGNKFFKLFYKKKRTLNVKKEKYNSLNPYNVNYIKKVFYKGVKNFKKLYLHNQGQRRSSRLILAKKNGVNNSFKRNFYKKENKYKFRKKKNKKNLFKSSEIDAIQEFIKKKDYTGLVSTNLRFNLKVIRDKFLLFNFLKMFFKLKKKMYNIFNRIYLNTISVIITICLKKYSRWKFTADYLNDLIMVKLKQKHRIKNVMKFVIKYLNNILKKKSILGYAILLKGRFSRKDRAVYELKRFGKTKKTNKISIIDFSNKSVNLTYSKASITIWITKNI